MTETPSIQPNPFDPDDPQHATWPEPFEPGRDLAELAIVNTTPTIQVPGISAADFLSEAERRNMRRKLVEDDYEQRMLGTLGGDLTRVYRHAHGAVLYFKQPGRIADQGDKLNGAFVVASGLEIGSPSLVPEPETYAMLLAGLGLMGAAIRRRQA